VTALAKVIAFCSRSVWRTFMPSAPQRCHTQFAGSRGKYKPTVAGSADMRSRFAAVHHAEKSAQSERYARSLAGKRDAREGGRCCAMSCGRAQARG
jgi:hypothetical protein